MNLNARRDVRLDPESIRLPLIALIDVVLFLLFYFIIAGSLAAEERELDTGLATSGPGTSSLQPQIVQVGWVQDHPEYRIGAHVFTDRTALVELLGRLPKGPGVAVRASPDAPIEATASAVQAARDAGFTNVGYAISPR